MLVKSGNFTIIDVDKADSSGKVGGSPGKDKFGGSPKELTAPPEKVETHKLNVGGKSGPEYERTLSAEKRSSGKIFTSKKDLGKGGSKSGATTKWENAYRDAFSRASQTLSDKAKRLLQDLKSSKPRVNWKREFRSFLDQTFSQIRHEIPNKRTIDAGDITYGIKKKGEDTLKTLVLAVDTSASISEKQIKAFLNEIFSLTRDYDIEETYILYTSDKLHTIDRVLKDKKFNPDLIVSKGGNDQGFIPPFRFIQKPRDFEGLLTSKQKREFSLPNTIHPSAVVYFTDTFAQYPSVNDFGISKYQDKVFWFICLHKDQQFNKPPFGRSIHVPMDRMGFTG